MVSCLWVGVALCFVGRVGLCGGWCGRFIDAVTRALFAVERRATGHSVPSPASLKHGNSLAGDAWGMAQLLAQSACSLLLDQLEADQSAYLGEELIARITSTLLHSAETKTTLRLWAPDAQYHSSPVVEAARVLESHFNVDNDSLRCVGCVLLPTVCV